MTQISPDALHQVQTALMRYRAEVEASKLRPRSKETYLGHATQFVQWLADDFVPGGTL